MPQAPIRSRLALSLAVAVTAAVLATAVPAGAAVFTPTRFDDPAPNGCPPSDCSLREAIIAANAAPDPDTINLLAGTYSLSIEGIGEDAAATGDLDVTEDVTINGAGAAATIIDGAWTTTVDRILHLVNATTDLIVSGVTLQDGGGAEDGAGILTAAGTTLNLSNSVVTSNETTGDVGGIWNEDGAATLVNVVVSVNSADACCGGIANTGGPMTIRGSTLRGNRTADDSGGIYNDDVLTITDSTIGGNLTTGAAAGTEGAGVYNVGQATLTNVTISGNSSTSFGGGLNADTSTSTSTLNNVTIIGNTADSDNDGSGNGGGINITAGSVALSNSIIAGNTDRGGQSPDCSGSFTSQGYNLVQNTNGCTGFTGPGDITAQDPRLGPLADNGGATMTHALLAGSPAINAGNPAPPGSGGSACASSDQRGLARNCDIGAYELVLCATVPANRIGTPADDSLTGTDGPDGFLGGDGNDTATGLAGDDAICLEGGDDTAAGGDGNDTFLGGEGNDTGKGAAGKDLLNGEKGRDRLNGGAGKDKLIGGGGKDRLNCGAGKKEVGKGGAGKDTALKCEKGKA